MRKSLFLVPVLFSLWAGDLDLSMKTSLTLSIVGPDHPVHIDGPIPVTLVFTNTSPFPVYAEIPYPNPYSLSFRQLSGERAEIRFTEPNRFASTLAVSLLPGEIYSRRHFLNRYMRFVAPGPVALAYEISVYVKPQDPENGDGQTLRFTGEFQILLVQESSDELLRELDSYGMALASSNPDTRMEATEALAFLETPVAIDYQAKLLTVDGAARIGVQALARQKAAKADAWILTALNHEESMVVSEALSAIDLNRIAADRARIRELLSSQNESIRWVVLDWMERHPDPSDQGAVEALLEEANKGLQAKAKKYLETLTHLE